MPHNRAFIRRPSAAMMVALLALFVALGGAGYAAETLPAGSVGAGQLRPGSVTRRALAPGAVGTGQLGTAAVDAAKLVDGSVGKSKINPNQIQARVTGSCATGSVSAIKVTGAVSCRGAAGMDFNTANPLPLPLGIGPTTIDTATLPAGSAYLVTTNPDITISPVTGAGQSIEVDCTLTAGSGPEGTQKRAVSTQTGPSPAQDTIPLTVVAASTQNPLTVSVSCTDITDTSGGSPVPTVTVTTAINALQVTGDTVLPYAG